MGRGLGEQRLVALFAGSCLLFNFPLLALWNVEASFAGVPLFPAALFFIWLVMIGVLGWIVEHCDDAGPADAVGPSRETGPAPPPTDRASG